MPLRVSVRVAITTQQFCSIETALNLFVSDGISKTAVWRKQEVLIKGTSQMRERSSHGTPVSFVG
jgi:ethanolamine ammonia-lyase small subunit